MLGTKN